MNDFDGAWRMRRDGSRHAAQHYAPEARITVGTEEYRICLEQLRVPKDGAAHLSDDYRSFGSDARRLEAFGVRTASFALDRADFKSFSWFSTACA
jgi:hypothetical protein